MNDATDTSETRLRLATTRQLPANVHLDAETASLREGFLALGAAAEAAGGQFDQAALITRLQQSSLAPRPAVTIAPRYSSPPSWQLLIPAAIAASVLLTVGWLAMGNPSSIKTTTLAKAGSSRAASSPFSEFTDDVSPLFSRGWNDPLDDEIALAEASLGEYTSGRYGLDASISRTSTRLQQLSQEIWQESL